MGQDAFLRGVPAGKVNVEHGVALQDPDTGHITQRDVATILLQYAPRRGDVLVHSGSTYMLDRLLEDNGVTRRFVVVAT